MSFSSFQGNINSWKRERSVSTASALKSSLRAFKVGSIDLFKQVPAQNWSVKSIRPGGKKKSLH